jgi:RNA 2',3'-cyclic 3'-phosphodiesterase
VRLHPDHFLHVMLQELGFVTDSPSRPDEISAERLEEFVQAAIEPVFSLSPFELVIGGANAFQDAVFLEIGDDGILSRLHNRLFDLAAHTSAPTYAYLPHCTVAHFDGTADPRDVDHVIQPWRDAQFGKLAVSEVEVVTLDPAEPYPLLRSYAVIPFRS